MIAEAFLPAFGSLGVGGIIAFAIGAIMLIDTDVPGFGIPGFADRRARGAHRHRRVLRVRRRAQARRRPVVTGSEELIGSVGEVLEGAGAERWARVHSEQWRVESAVPLARGQRVRVTARRGLVLTVVPVEQTNQGV